MSRDKLKHPRRETTVQRKEKRIARTLMADAIISRAKEEILAAQKAKKPSQKG